MKCVDAGVRRAAKRVIEDVRLAGYADKELEAVIRHACSRWQVVCVGVTPLELTTLRTVWRGLVDDRRGLPGLRARGLVEGDELSLLGEFVVDVNKKEKR